MMNVRAASERDLAAMYAVYYLNEVGADENIPPLSPQNVPAVLRHVFETGTMSVAEQDGRVLAFAGAITRGPEPLATDLEVVEGEAGDPAFVQWDAQVGGRARPVDHAFWLEQQHAVPLWFRRQGGTLGYGYVRQVAATLLTPRTWVVGPVGVSAPAYATECVLAAIRWAEPRAERLRIDVPGPHPCLAPLLERGFQIIYVETFHSTASFFA